MTSIIFSDTGFTLPGILLLILLTCLASAVHLTCSPVHTADENGYCYLIAFKGKERIASAVLGAYPKGAEVETLYFSLFRRYLYDSFEAVPSGDVFHMVHKQHGSFAAATTWLRDSLGDYPTAAYVYGSTSSADALVSDINNLVKSMPITNDIKRTGSRYVSALRSEMPHLPHFPRYSIPKVARPIRGDDEAVEAKDVLRKMNTVSALEASKVLLSGMDSLGSTEDRLALAMETFPKGIPTAVPPSSPAYARLLSLLGPLSYKPATEGHAAAGTIRRAAMNHAVKTLEGAIVGLISPSKAEVHAFPMAAVWQYTDKTDLSRNHAHCTRCKAPRCFVLQAAKDAGRYYSGQDQYRAAALFKKFSVSALLLINIEPNINACDLTRLMVSSGAYTALSLVTVDWRVLLGRTVVDPLIGMTTEESFGKIVSSFHDSGDYVQSYTNVKQLFAPTYAAGHAMRRTVLFGDGASQYFQVTLVQGGWATRCVPQHEKYYFIRLVLPDLTRPVVLVEREGFDRVLATYRTQAVKGKDAARIVLRQSVVTYSISGTQVTPRLRLTATEAEALSVWIEVYSEVQDVLANKHAEAMRPSTITSDVKSALFKSVSDTLSRSAPGAMAMGSYSSVEALLRAYRTTVGENTIEQLSQAAMQEHFGVKVEPMSLQNMVVSAWGSLFSWVRSPAKWLETIESNFREAWRVGFTLVDAVNTTILLTGQFTFSALRVSVDCLQVACRILGRTDTLRHVDAFIAAMDWQLTKANKFWVTVQSAQGLDFQAAVIDIVETFFNTFSADHAVQIQRIRETNLIPEEQIRELELNSALPYSDFLSEVKLFLGKFNCTARKCAMAAMLLSAFSNDCRKADEAQRSKMVHLLKREIETVEHDVARQVMEFALGGAPQLKPLPLRPIDHQDVREAFRLGRLTLTSPDGPVTLRKLEKVGSHFDFSPIHALMDIQHGQVIGPDIKGPNYISPDDRGARVQEQLIAASSTRGLGARIVAPASMPEWYARQVDAPGQLDFVRDILIKRQNLFTGQQASNWLAHVTGLAMGGKSKGLRSWISAQDVVVVPTRQLKEEWQENLGKLEPVRRATVVTQHEALDVKYASRYVFIDECYAFDPEHLQAIANRHVRSQGVITIGDRRQIANVFTNTGIRLLLNECPCVMITPTTFVGWDAAAVYLNTTTTDVYVENLFCGSDDPESLCYTLNADDTLLPGEGDKSIQGTQAAKEMMLQRGVTCNTVHECQGSRTENTVVHGLGVCLAGDLRWLGFPDQASHAGVLITRARRKTVFVLEGLETMNAFRWFDEQTVNGPLPKTIVYGGTAWDLVEPRAESESTWVHVHEPRLPETGLVEQPLTDPITVATIFDQHGEPISTSEIRTNVELVSGVVFSDLGIANSDKFDNYTAQPRDVPGADQVQALTRSVPDVKPTAGDYRDAELIVQWIFEEVLDKKLFFSHLANSRRAALKRQTRQQVIDGCYANVETAASTLSFAFLKPEFAKKPSTMIDGPSELKAQGVVSASDMQQALFADTCDSLTHAWARAMRPGKLSPVGFREEEVEDFLGTFDHSYELDIEKQDSSHKPVHILVAGVFLELASDKLGLSKVAEEIRFERRVRMMGSPFKFVLNKALASGDPWTLIINKIMAVSSLISVARLKDVKMCQSGDDVTLDREPEWRGTGLHDNSMANKGLTWKKEERQQRIDGVTFISRAVLANRTVVYKALRTILKYMSTPRNSIQHAGINADSRRIDRLAAKHGLQAYAEARCQVWGGDPVVVFDLWTRALSVARTPFEQLPDELKKDEPRQYTIRERNGGCFGFALANCVSDNVMAINAIAKYRGPVTMSEALQACRDNKVSCLLMNEKFANRSRKRLQDEMDRRHFSKAFVVVYEDHAVAVVPNTLTIHSGFGKRQITWKSSMSKDVEITDFE